jgi:hypothetical protein
VGTIAEGLVHALPAAAEGDKLTAREVELSTVRIIDLDVSFNAKRAVVTDGYPGSHDWDPPVLILLALLGCLQRVDWPWLASLGKCLGVGLTIMVIRLILQPLGNVDRVVDSGKDRKVMLAI